MTCFNCCNYHVCSGGEITSTFDHPELVKLGHCKLIEEVMIGEDTLIHFSGVAMGTPVLITRLIVLRLGCCSSRLCLSRAARV